MATVIAAPDVPTETQDKSRLFYFQARCSDEKAQAILDEIMQDYNLGVAGYQNIDGKSVEILIDGHYIGGVLAHVAEVE